MVPFKTLLHRRGDAALQAGDVVAEVRARGRQAQRPRRHRPHQPPLLVLRDARQLQLRRLLQGRRDPVGVGVLHATCSQLDLEPALGHGARGRRRGRAHLARRRRLPGRPDPAPRRRQLLAHGRHRPVRAVVGDLLGPRPRARSRRRSGDRGTTATSRSGISCSCSSTSRPTARASRCPKPSIDTGAGLERNLLVVQGKTSIWDIDVFRPLHRARPSASPARATATTSAPTCRCASSPSTRAR